jgi:hypothetical protein
MGFGLDELSLLKDIVEEIAAADTTISAAASNSNDYSDNKKRGNNTIISNRPNIVKKYLENVRESRALSKTI